MPLGKGASAGDWIHDFVHSTNPQFRGKSVKERQRMALGAYYANRKRTGGLVNPRRFQTGGLFGGSANLFNPSTTTPEQGVQYSPGGMPQGGYNQAEASGAWWSPGGMPQGGTGFPVTPAPLPEGSQVSSNWVSPYGQDYGVTPGYQYTPPPLPSLVRPPITNANQVPGTYGGKSVSDLYAAAGITQLTPAEMAQLKAMPAPPPWPGAMTNPTAAQEQALNAWIAQLPAPLQAQATRGGTLAKYLANPSFWNAAQGSNWAGVAYVPNQTKQAWTPQTQRDLAAQYGYAPRSVAREIQNTPGGPTTTRYDYQPIDTANIMQTLKNMGWQTSQGWNQTASAINPLTGKPYTAAQQQMFKDLQASIAPRNPASWAPTRALPQLHGAAAGIYAMPGERPDERSAAQSTFPAITPPPAIPQPLSGPQLPPTTSIWRPYSGFDYSQAATGINDLRSNLRRGGLVG